MEVFAKRGAFIAMGSVLVIIGLLVYAGLAVTAGHATAMIGASLYVALVALTAFLSFLPAIRAVGVRAVLGLSMLTLALYILVAGVIGRTMVSLMEVVTGIHEALVHPERIANLQPQQVTTMLTPVLVSAALHMIGFAFLVAFAVLVYSYAREVFGVELPGAERLIASTLIPILVAALSITAVLAVNPRLLPPKPLMASYAALVMLGFTNMALLLPLAVSKFEAGLVEEIVRLTVISIALQILGEYIAISSRLVAPQAHMAFDLVEIALATAAYAVLIRAGVLASRIARAAA